MNLEKLDAAIAYIEKHPEKHSQASWFFKSACRTTACLAGTLAVLDGWEPVWLSGYGTAEHVKKGEVQSSTSRVAVDILGATSDEADALFLGAQDLDEIQAVRDAIEAGQPPWSALPELPHEPDDPEEGE